MQIFKEQPLHVFFIKKKKIVIMKIVMTIITENLLNITEEKYIP